jgi:hypothetical protein
MQGQTNGSLASEQSVQFRDLNLGQLSALFTEFVVIDKVIIQYTAANWTIQEVDKLTGSKVNPGSTPAGSYLSAVSVTAPLTGNGTSVTPLTIPAATTSVSGYLASTDWNTFNGKQAAYTLLTTFGSLANATGFLKNNGSGVLSYDNTPQNTALWGSITGASAQAAPAGGWTGNHGPVNVTTLKATDTVTITKGVTGDLMYFQESGITKWTVYAPSTGKLAFYGPGGLTQTWNADLTVTFASSVSMGALGTNGKTPQTSASVNAACTDLATAIALINQLRAALIANGICV